MRQSPHSRPWTAFLLAALGAACLLGGKIVAADNAAQAPRRPNVLFLLSDDQRYDTIAALGNEHIRTPHLDRLARAGVTFTRAYYMGGMHGAVCAPSRAMLHSGHSLFRVREDLAGQTTWPEMFRQAAYTTFATGKWHNKAPALLRSFSQGQAIFLGGMGDPYHLRVQDISPTHKLVNPRFSGAHSVQLFADAAVDFLERQTGDQPFLCYVAFNAPHDPRIAPPQYHAKYNAVHLPLPPNFLPLHPFNNGELAIRDERLAPWPRTPDIVRQNLADYFSYITFMDAQIGRILAALEKSGQYDNTIIVFATDNGLALGSHGLFGKQNLYEHSTHLPLIFAGPGIAHDQRCDAFCYLFDIFPTLGELCGVAAPQGNEGESLAPALRGAAAARRGAIFTVYRHLQRAVRNDSWKLIIYPQINKTQLFDLRADPAEMQDLAGNPAHADDVARMTALLQACQQKFGDKQALTTDHPQPLEFDFSKVPARSKK